MSKVRQRAHFQLFNTLNKTTYYGLRLIDEDVKECPAHCIGAVLRQTDCSRSQ